MSSVRLLATLLAVLATNILALDDDFAFEISDDLEVEFDPESTKKTLDVPNKLTASVGRVFHFSWPNYNGDNIMKYEAKADGDKPLPLWLLFDKTGGIFWGLPLSEDIGIIHITVKTLNLSENTSNEFILEVYEDGHTPVCPPNEDNTVLMLVLDKQIQSIKPKQRIIAINTIAKFFGLTYGAFSLQPQDQPDDLSDNSIVLAGPGNIGFRTSKLSSVIRVIVGCDGRLWLNSATLVHQLKQQARDGTIAEVLRLPLIGWRVKTEKNIVTRRKRDVDDLGPGSGAGEYDDDDEDYYANEYDYDGDDTDDFDDNHRDSVNDVVTQSTTTTTKSTTKVTPTTIKTTAAITTAPSTTTQYTTNHDVSSTHHHRHHHGQIPIDATNVTKHRDQETESNRISSSYFTTSEITTSIKTTESDTVTPLTTTMPTKSTIITSHPDVTEPEVVTEVVKTLKPEDTLSYDDEDEEYVIDDDLESETVVPVVSEKPKVNILTDTVTSIVDIATTKPEIVEFIPETTPMSTQSTTTTTTTTTTSTTTLKPLSTTTEILTTVKLLTTEEETEVPNTYFTTNEGSTTTLSVDEDTTTSVKQTTVRHVTTTPKITTTYYATETIEYDVKNFPPTIQNRLKRIATTAGKAFSYIIPLNTFSDLEDGNNLLLEILDNEGKPLQHDSWCQFNSRTREIYGLPLEDHVSRWEYILKATDKDGASVVDPIEIMVQQHKSRRVVNHEFSLYMHIEKKWEFPHDIDWSLKTLRGIGRMYRQSNLTDIIVRRVNYTSEPVIFVWTNDSLPKSYCPTVEIEKLFELLTANNEGDPSHALTRELIPELRVKKVMYHGLGVCENKPQPPPLVPIIPPTNFSPILRNPVDHINATVGELLVFKVPDDTFYDPEDVDSRNLKMSLLTVDRQQIPSDHWLQFDSKNKEFYGIPLPQDVGRSEYQLICEDSGGLPASDSLVVVVHVPPRIQYNVEFSMTVETPYETFVNSANMQRKFIEKLRDLFSDQNTSFVHLSSISRGSTIVSWYNKSLSLEDCPRSVIKQLESILVNNDRTIASRVQDIMDPEFTVSTIKLQLIGSCKGRPDIQSPTSKGVPIEEPPLSDHEDYLITFIVPAVIISAMLLLAGIFACVLYRRRRTGKMNVEEDGRSTYGNKGIPVIFQEELEEKPEPGTKAPIILKDEKPPLAPPEYSKSGSLKLTDDSEPYQPPPPPFTRPQDNGRQSRPKPTPTYRKPPPYVPP